MYDAVAFAAELPRSSDKDLLQMRDWALRREQAADAPGTGRNPKARRQFRLQRELAEAEMLSRELL